jgi:hypothetical protein
MPVAAKKATGFDFTRLDSEQKPWEWLQRGALMGCEATTGRLRAS